jgi:hypothetical protein
MQGARTTALAFVLLACGARTELTMPDRDGGPDAGRDGGSDAGRDAGRPCDAGTLPILGATPLRGTSCTGTSSGGLLVIAEGCPRVEIQPRFIDRTDGSDGQTSRFARSLDAGCVEVTWDDCPSGCDCDLDITHELCVETSATCDQLTVTIRNTITEYEAGNTVEAGYEIDGQLFLRGSGDDTRTFTYLCP